MQYILKILCAFVFINGCSSSESVASIELEILEKEIESRKISNFDVRQILTNESYIYDSVSVNKINIKLKNTGAKTCVLFLNREFDNAEKVVGNLKFNVFKNGTLIQPKYNPLMVQLTSKAFEARRIFNDADRDSIMWELEEKYRKEEANMGRIKFDRKTQYVVIHPRESKFFTYYVTLPVFRENVSDFYFYDFSNKGDYFFQMTITNEASSLKRNLSSNQQKEIKENDYTLFNGTIMSNKIPVKVKNW